MWVLTLIFIAYIGSGDGTATTLPIKYNSYEECEKYGELFLEETKVPGPKYYACTKVAEAIR